MKSTQSDDKESAFDEVMELYHHVSNTLNATFKRYNDLEDLYFFHTPTKKRSTKSNVFDPMAFDQVEYMVSHLGAGDPRGEFSPIEPGDELATDLMNELWKYQWNMPQADMYKKIVNTIRRSGIYGTAWGVVRWRYERVFNKSLNKFITVWDDWCYDSLNVYDCYPDLDAQSPKEMRFFIHDEYLTLEDLKQQDSVKGKKRYKNIDELEKLIDDEDDTAASVDNSYRNNLLTRRKLGDGLRQEGRILVRRCYYPDRWVSILPDYKLTIEDNENPYNFNGLPVVCLTDQDVPGIVLGIGEIDPPRTLMTTMNQIINMRLDNVKMILEKPMIAKKTALEHMKTWLWGRNSVMVVNQEGDLKPMEIPDVTGNTFVQTMQFLTDVIKSRSGRGDFLSSNRGNKTATEIDAMASEQNARLNYKLKNIEQFIKDISVMGMQLNQQFLKKDKWVRILGEENVQKLNLKYPSEMDGTNDRLKLTKSNTGFLKVKPEDIAGAFDFTVESKSTMLANTKQEIQDSMMLLDTLTKFGPAIQAQGKEVNPIPILENIMVKLGQKKIDQIISNAPQPNEATTAPGLNAPMPTGGVPSLPGMVG